MVLSATHPLDSIPALHSNPGAPATLYLDFDGHFEPVWGGYTNATTPAYDVDGDASSFSDKELQNIEEIWARLWPRISPPSIWM